jgi:phage-related protein
LANNTKMNISYSIKAIDRFTKTHARLAKQLSGLKSMQNSLMNSPTMSIDANTKQATKALANFEKKIEKIEVDMRALDTLDLEVDVNAKDALKELKRLTKTITKMEKEIEIEIETNYDENNLPTHIQDNIDMLNKMRKRVAGFDTKVRTEMDLNTQPVFKKLKDLEMDLADISKVEIKTEADVGPANKHLDSTQKKIDRLRSSVEMDVKMGTRRTKRELNSLHEALASIKSMASRLNNERARVDVEADTAAANVKVSRFKQLVDSIPGRKHVQLSVDGFRRGVKRADSFATNLRTIEEISQGVGRGLVSLMLPSIGVALGVAAGAAGAFASGLLGAGSAAGAFALVAVPTISHLKEMDETVKRGSKQWYELSKGTREALTALDGLRSTWSEVQAAFREDVLGIFALNLQGAREALNLFTPTIAGAVSAVRDLSEAFNSNLMSDDVKGIFEWLGNTAGPYLEKYTKAIGNFIVGFMNMMVAFDPLAQDFADGLLNMSNRFREWSSTLENNKAFQDFLAYTSENGPLLLSFLGNLIRFLVDLGIAMAPIGEEVLKITNGFFKWASGVLEAHGWIGKVIAVILLAKGAFGLLVPLLSVATIAFKTLWPVVSQLFTWFGKLQGVIIRLLPWVSRVGMFILRLSGPIGIIISIVGLLASILISHWDEIWAWTKQTFANIARWIIEKWKQVKAFWSVLGELVSILKTKFGEMVSAVFEKMGEIYKDIKGKWNDIKSFLSGISLKSIGANIIQGLINGITSIDVKGAVEGVASKIKDGFLGFFNIHSPSRLMKKDVGRWITLGVLDGMTSMQSKAEREAERVANAIKRPFDTMSTDYAFSASGTAVARQSYENARTSRYQTSATSEGSTSPETKQPGVQYAVVNIGGYEAKGAIEYITQEQARAKSRKERFKG